MPSQAPNVEKVEKDFVTLSWQPGEPDPVTYNVEIKFGDNDWETVKGNIDGTTCKVDAPANHETFFRIRAKNEYGESEPTDEISVPKRAGPPIMDKSQPTFRTEKENVQLQWKPAKNQKEYIDVPIWYSCEMR